MYRVVCVVARWRECGTFEDANLHKKNDMIGDALLFFCKTLSWFDLSAFVAGGDWHWVYQTLVKIVNRV